jgi:hypothetical protein
MMGTVERFGPVRLRLGQVCPIDVRDRSSVGRATAFYVADACWITLAVAVFETLSRSVRYCALCSQGVFCDKSVQTERALQPLRIWSRVAPPAG